MTGASTAGAYRPRTSEAAEAFLKVFRKRIIARVGAPKTLISDNGVQFTGKKTKTAMEQWRVRQQFTAPYTPHQSPNRGRNSSSKTSARGSILKSIPKANNSQSRGTKDTDIGQRSAIHGEENKNRHGAVEGTTAIFGTIYTTPESNRTHK